MSHINLDLDVLFWHLELVYDWLHVHMCRPAQVISWRDYRSESLMWSAELAAGEPEDCQSRIKYQRFWRIHGPVAIYIFKYTYILLFNWYQICIRQGVIVSTVDLGADLTGGSVLEIIRASACVQSSKLIYLSLLQHRLVQWYQNCCPFMLNTQKKKFKKWWAAGSEEDEFRILTAWG